MAKIDGFGDFHPITRQEWRDWLAENHNILQGIWFVYFKKHTGRPRVSYDESVEEALCFGWIDSLARKLDEDRSKLLFTPRKPKSVWSKPNKERVEKLVSEGLIAEAGMAKIEAAKADGSWNILDASDDLEISEGLRRAFEKDSVAFGNFDNFSDSVKKVILSWIYSAKSESTKAKRINEAVSMARLNLRARFDKREVD